MEEVKKEELINYPTEWKIVNAYSPFYWDSFWDKHMVGSWKKFKENTVIVRWERDVAPYTVEIKIEQIELSFPQNK